MSETDFLKLKKHDNVETNTEKFDIENYLNGNWDKINKNAKEVNTKISNINSNNTELEKELKEAQEDFYQNSIRGQASGEYIHVEDSSNCRAKIGIGGNHEQETRSGKNYLNTLAKYKAGEKVTVDGITYIFNEDGSITCNGTATADSVLTFSSNLQTINGSGKKIVGMITGTQVPAKLSILAYTSDWSKNTFELLSSVNKNITINMQENIDYTIFRIIAYKGTTLNNQTIYYQILDTSVNDLTYEQYGASPSPDYPSKIKTVGSNINLFNKDTATLLDNIYIDATSQKIGSASGYCSLYLSCKPNKTYTVSKIQSARFCIAYSDSSTIKVGDTVNVMKAENSSTVLTGKIGANAKTLIIMYSKSSEETVTKQEILDSIKIVEGTEVGEYSKYNQGSTKIVKCNTNLYDGKNEVGGINNDGSLSSTTDRWRTINYINVKNLKNLIIRVYDIETSGALGRYCLYDDKYNFLSSVQILNTQTDLKVDNASYLKFWFLNEKVASSAQVQVEEGNTAKKYNQHEEQSYIIPVQSEMLEGDYFDFDNEEEVHVWGNVIVNGTETINKNSNSEFFSITKSMSQFDTSATGIEQSISNYGTGTTLALGSGNTNNKYSFNASTIYLDCYNSNINTVEKLKVQLTKNNMKIYAKLATPQRIAFTEEQKAVTKELSNARTYKNVTNITTDSKAILSLDYVKDQETQNQKIQNEIDEIKQLLSTAQTSAMLLDNLQKEVESEVE